jgi:translation initiation factor IF-2
MPEGKILRLSKVAGEFNISISRIIEAGKKHGINVDGNPNSKITPDMYDILVKEFQAEKSVKEAANKFTIDITKRETISLEENKASKEAEQSKIKFDEDIKHKDLIIKNVKTATRDLTAFKEPENKAAQKHKETIVEKPPEKEKVKQEKAEEEETLKKTAKKTKKEEEAPSVTEEVENEKTAKAKGKLSVKVKGKMNLDDLNQKTKPDRKAKVQKSKVKSKKGKEAEEEVKIITEEETKKKEEKVSKVHPKETVIEKEEPAEELIEEREEVLPPVSDIIPHTSEEEEIQASEQTIPENFMRTEYVKIDGPKILGKMSLPVQKEFTKKAKEKNHKREKPSKLKDKKKSLVSGDKSSVAGKSTDQPINKSAIQQTEDDKDFKKKRKRIESKVKLFNTQTAPPEEKFKNFRAKEKKFKKTHERLEVKQEDIDKQIKETLARLSSTGKTKASKYRKQKRELYSKQKEVQSQRTEEEKKILKVTEFVTANELATLMNVGVNEIISICMNLGMFVSINQRLDAETLSIVADEFGYKLDFVTVDLVDSIKVEEDKPEDLVDRPPIVTVMGHVDHGKTSLLDYIRKTNVIAGEAGGITQHIGAYEVTLENGKNITFLDTPGHEAFTAMRARGTKITDVVIIVVAADEDIMPQTIEAINHASAGNVPIVFAINKIDKPNANIDKIKEGLAKLNYLVEDWGGKYQCQEISAKKGTNVDALLVKVLLEAELLELKANPNKRAYGSVIESSLDKGKGYVAKLLVQNGTLNIGDIIVAGYCFGRVKAMYNERNTTVREAGPSAPLLLLGLNGAPQAGDTFNVFANEHEAKDIATKRLQLQREQSLRTQKHITLDEIGRRIAIGDFKQLNIIVKGDVDGSVEALADSLLKLSSEQVQVNVIHKSVGQITESDILLASASDAVIIGFQVRPSPAARKLALQEQIDIRLYSIIYNAINELKSAIEGMLSPEIVEKTTSNIEVKEVFKITKVGTVAGCFVLDGKITKNTKVHLIREGIVVYTGDLSSLKHFKEDAKDVKSGMECGISIRNFNDIKVGDIIEGFEEIEVQRKLS